MSVPSVKGQEPMRGLCTKCQKDIAARTVMFFANA